MLDSGSTMEIIQLVIGITLIVSVVALLMYAIYNAIRTATLSEEESKFDKIRSLYSRIQKGKSLNPKKIAKHAAKPEYRTLVYEALKKHDNTEAFPETLLTIEKSSESYLANWLNMHDDFDSLPAGIHYEETVQLQNGITFLAYKFKVYEPHLYANKKWMIGYVGYKAENPKAYAHPEYIWSHFKYEFVTEKELEKITQQKTAL
jgi:hypothetical protein